MLKTRVPAVIPQTIANAARTTVTAHNRRAATDRVIRSPSAQTVPAEADASRQSIRVHGRPNTPEDVLIHRWPAEDLTCVLGFARTAAHLTTHLLRGSRRNPRDRNPGRPSHRRHVHGIRHRDRLDVTIHGLDAQPKYARPPGWNASQRRRQLG